MEDVCSTLDSSGEMKRARIALKKVSVGRQKRLQLRLGRCQPRPGQAVAFRRIRHKISTPACLPRAATVVPRTTEPRERLITASSRC
ncbi:Protein of unknown function [Gryllus bimaculatus]|nr:Protein of unknown function [Gryllus bimaculatus]